MIGADTFVVIGAGAVAIALGAGIVFAWLLHRRGDPPPP